jgi:hypothetical protein
MKILNVQWPIIIATTLVLYVLVILAMPFNMAMSTIFLFAIIAYWSRLPGVGIPHPFYILYQADVIDIFTLIIAIHVNPFYAVAFTVFCNLGSRAAGTFPSFQGVCQDAIIQSVIALIAPLLYAITGNLVTVVGIYSVLRILGFIILGFIWPLRSIPVLFLEEMGAGVAVFIINMFYAKMFGSFFENLLMQGVGFNWVLFLVVTILIVIILIVVFGLSPKEIGAKVVNNVAKRMIVREKKAEMKNDDIESFNEISRSI